MVASVVTFLAILLLTVVASVIASIDWELIISRLVVLALMLAFLYWTTTLLPGPVKKVGRAVGRGVVRAVRNKRQGR